MDQPQRKIRISLGDLKVKSFLTTPSLVRDEGTVKGLACTDCTDSSNDTTCTACTDASCVAYTAADCGNCTDCTDNTCGNTNCNNCSFGGSGSTGCAYATDDTGCTYTMCVDSNYGCETSF